MTSATPPPPNHAATPLPRPWRTRVEEALGALGPPLAIGNDVYLVEVTGRALVVKVGGGGRDEAAGLRCLAGVAGAPPVPEIVLAEEDLLVTTAVAQAPRSAGHEEDLGRALARLHAAPCAEWGGGSSWIGSCRVDPAPGADAAGFYGARLRELAGRCGLEAPVARVAARLEELIPAALPALVHGDLWWGNVLFGSDGRTWLVDPSVHGGHPEEDLAMLALFGQVPDRLRRAYEEVRPLESGWEDRVALFQLCPLLVHTVLFGGGYRAQAEVVARRYA